MHLNLPIFDQIAGCENLLIAGMGGGFDIFCGLPIYFELQARGQKAHLANFSFSPVNRYPYGTRLSDRLVGVIAEGEMTSGGYFPELYLAHWFKQARGEDITIWCFDTMGAAPLLDNYRILVEHLKIDGILLIDGGVDSLARGNETQAGTLVEDAISLYAVNQLKEIPVRIVGCIALGAEQQVDYSQIFENIAALTEANGFFGACALVPQMEAYLSYEDAVRFVHQQENQQPSVINSSIVSAVRGKYGNYHLTERTRGSILSISPLMALYWFFDLRRVAQHNVWLNQIGETNTVLEAAVVYTRYNRVHGARRSAPPPIP